MNYKKITASAISFTATTLVASISLVPAYAASLDTSTAASVTATANTSSINTNSVTSGSGSVTGSSNTNVKAGTEVTTQSNKNTGELSKIVTRGNSAISAGINALNTLAARVQAAKNISASEKTSLSNSIQTNINGLSSLKTKIDADTDNAVALNDEKSITESYRIYALVMPQGYILASADRIGTITSMLNTISTKLQARISAEQSAGTNVTSMQNALIDLKAKVADASVQASAAESGTAALSPDQGNSSIQNSNKAALVAARTHIKTATSDVKSAEQDAKTIITALKTSRAKTSVSGSATVESQ